MRLQRPTLMLRPRRLSLSSDLSLSGPVAIPGGLDLKNIVKILFRLVIRNAAYSVLVGQRTSPASPDPSTFSGADVKTILVQTWKAYDSLAQEVPHEPTIGSQMNVFLACITLSAFHSLRATGVERGYAIELVRRMSWRIYRKWGRIALFIARVRTVQPERQLRLCVNMFLRFPFSPPGYRFERLSSDDGVSLDMVRCPIAEYFRDNNAPDLGVGTWCDLDYPLAAMWGGWLERTKTLATGAPRCDFRFRSSSNY